MLGGQGAGCAGYPLIAIFDHRLDCQFDWVCLGLSGPSGRGVVVAWPVAPSAGCTGLVYPVVRFGGGAIRPARLCAATCAQVKAFAAVAGVAPRPCPVAVQCLGGLRFGAGNLGAAGVAVHRRWAHDRAGAGHCAGNLRCSRFAYLGFIESVAAVDSLPQFSMAVWSAKPDPPTPLGHDPNPSLWADCHGDVGELVGANGVSARMA